jgi:hypothetical protein
MLHYWVVLQNRGDDSILYGRNLYIVIEMYLKDYVVCVDVDSMVETGEENL